ncbi:MAG: hypothetical protein C0591_02645 [Marinilabiliales bacterium]|nr:MAG: hypothetical protein C0591_02645 [Marinilabiliales bacterium]
MVGSNINLNSKMLTKHFLENQKGLLSPVLIDTEIIVYLLTTISLIFMQSNRRLFFIFLASLLYFIMVSANQAHAQEKGSKWFVDNPKPLVINWDTAYYSSYMEQMTIRWYSSVKYTGFRILNMEEKQNLLYLSNVNYIIGAGISYSWFTLNIGINYYPIINNDEDIYGPTTYLDLQSHIYLRKMNIDLYAQYYEGYYLANSGNVINDWPQGDTFQIRPDIYTLTLGFNYQYVFNWKKFSYKAIYNQNEWQKKSAGSWVLGANAFYYTNRGDSTLIPANLKNTELFNNLDYSKQNVLNLGISGGYYYTLVLFKHYFISAGVAGGPSIGNSWLNTENIGKVSFSNVALNLNVIARASIGYNSEKFFAGFSFLQQMFFNQIPSENIWTNFHTGNARIYFVYRFPIKKPLKIANPRYWKLFNKSN